MLIHSHLKTFVKAAVLILTLSAASTARAQFGEAAGIAEAMQADYLRRDIVLFQQGLNLDDAQRDIIDALYTDYEQAFEEGLANMRNRIDGMREELQSQDIDRVLRIVFKPIEEWCVEKRGIGASFMDNVKVVLTPEQQEQWPKFERFIFREKNLSKGTLSGESLNLFHVVRDMQLNEPEMGPVQVVLDEYDFALDEALKNRQQTLTANQSDMLRSFAEQNSPVSLAILQRQVGMAIAVRNVNDRFIDPLAQSMPEARREEFRLKALERAYPRVYRATPVQGIFKAARELEGLDSATLDAIAAMEAAYVSQLTALNEQLAEVVRHWEPEEQRLRAKAFAQRMADQTPDEIVDTTREAFLKRDELSRDFTRQLKGLLTDEQFAQLPGGYRWADLPGEVKPGIESFPVGPGGGIKPEDPPRGEPDSKAPKEPVEDDGGGGGEGEGGGR